MVKRGVNVNDPQSVVLVDNVSNSHICLPRSGQDDILFGPRETAQITWAEFVRFKNIPNFGRFLKLNDSVVISDGMVKIKNVGNQLSEDEMVGMLVQNVASLKEFVLHLNKGERELFKSFLISRSNLGIEQEKCEELVEFIDTEFGEGPTEEVEEIKPAMQTKGKRTSRKRGRKSKVAENIEATENDENMSAHITRTSEED